MKHLTPPAPLRVTVVFDGEFIARRGNATLEDDDSNTAHKQKYALENTHTHTNTWSPTEKKDRTGPLDVSSPSVELMRVKAATMVDGLARLTLVAAFAIVTLDRRGDVRVFAGVPAALCRTGGDLAPTRIPSGGQVHARIVCNTSTRMK